MGSIGTFPQLYPKKIQLSITGTKLFLFHVTFIDLLSNSFVLSKYIFINFL